MNVASPLIMSETISDRMLEIQPDDDELQAIGASRTGAYIDVLQDPPFIKHGMQRFYVNHIPGSPNSQTTRVVFMPWSEDPSRPFAQRRAELEALVMDGVETFMVSNPSMHPVHDLSSWKKMAYTQKQKESLSGPKKDLFEDRVSLADVANAEVRAVKSMITKVHDVEADDYLRSRLVVGCGSSFGSLVLAGAIATLKPDVAVFHEIPNPVTPLSISAFLAKMGPGFAKDNRRYLAQNRGIDVGAEDGELYRFVQYPRDLFLRSVGAIANAPFLSDIMSEEALQHIHDITMRAVVVSGTGKLSPPLDNQIVVNFLGMMKAKAKRIEYTNGEHPQGNSLRLNADIQAHALATADKL